MKNTIFISVFSLCVFTSFSQSKKELREPVQFFTHMLYSKGYLHALDTLVSQSAAYDTSSQWRSTYYQMLGTAYSFVENDLKARLSFDKMYGKSSSVVSLNMDSLCSSYSKVISAKEYILKKANESRIIMINEAHHIPQHRVLTYSILKDLYDKGFHYLAVEAYHVEDSLLSIRGYPALSDKGFYIREPVFANLLRYAIHIGYQLIPYDDESSCLYDRKKPNYCKNNRDLNQAVNLYKIFQKDANAKVLVHAGYGHILESTTSDWIKMAEFFKVISGIDPLTIDQTYFMESVDSNLGKEYNYITQKYLFDRPSILLNSSNEPFSFGSSGKMDLNVFWPKIVYKNHRPVYFDYINFKEYPIPKKYTTTGYLIQAFSVDENKEAIPIDQIYIEETKEKYALRLPIGHYRIRISTKHHMSIVEFNIDMH